MFESNRNYRLYIEDLAGECKNIRLFTKDTGMRQPHLLPKLFFVKILFNILKLSLSGVAHSTLSLAVLTPVAIIERFFRTPKEERICHYNFTSLKKVNDIITKWIHFFSNNCVTKYKNKGR